MNKKDMRVHIRASSELFERLDLAAELTDKPKSQIIREALNEKLKRIARSYPEHSETLAPAA